MAAECASLSDCAFYQKHQTNRDPACRASIQQYCKGPKKLMCKRMRFLHEHGMSPSPDMLPDGTTIRRAVPAG
ncbi:MAG: hypothetical protein JXA69_00755 [Phycisphaerae bacterium]|nr:hypothetical protein [Phycisphaerae bacterium]